MDADAAMRKILGRQLAGKWGDKLSSFIRDGYVIFEGAVSHTAIDKYRSELQLASQGGTKLLASVPTYGPADKAVIPLEEADIAVPLTKVLDTFAVLPGAYPVMFNDTVREFLKIVFQDDILAFQGLHFERGSTQAIHQDTAYVVVDKPLNLCASWVALEDVKAGSGELIYYPGSHRLPDWVYSNEHKHYNHERDTHDEHLGHLEALKLRSAEAGYALQSFLPKKGDMLIWSADLAHGGSEITDPTATRRSLVTHYTAASSNPHYFNYLPEERKLKKPVGNGCFTSSFYY
ncbi:phytanoyl-CoA dioxygenase family protein [Achromobacter aegrifaciens]